MQIYASELRAELQSRVRCLAIRLSSAVSSPLSISAVHCYMCFVLFMCIRGNLLILLYLFLVVFSFDCYVVMYQSLYDMYLCVPVFVFLYLCFVFIFYRIVCSVCKPSV